MNNIYTSIPEMETVWDRFYKNEEPTEEELEALYLALKEKREENAKSDALRKIDDPSYSRPKCLNGLDSEGEGEAFTILNGFTHERFEKRKNDIIGLLETVYEYMG